MHNTILLRQGALPGGWVANVATDQANSGGEIRGQCLRGAVDLGIEVIEDSDLAAAAKKFARQMRTDKTGTSGDEYPGSHSHASILEHFPYYYEPDRVCEVPI
jgi:hypothetical protein